MTFGIKDGFQAVEKINKNTNETYIVGGGSKSNFWANLVGSAINKTIIVGEDSNLGPSLGVARLAMLATKKYKLSQYSDITFLILENYYQVYI